MKMMWYPPMKKIEFITVKEMYAYTKENHIKLLSDYTAEFWAEYLQNYEQYDRLFNRMFLNSYYFIQETDEPVETVQPNFTEAVYDLLLMNTKRYSELYRINVVDDEAYSIIDNYDVTETREGSFSKDITDNFGQRVSTGNDVSGAQINTVTGEVAPYDSETFANESKSTQNLGQRTDTNARTVNAVEDSHAHEGTDEYELHRKGNIGVQTQSEVMEKHKKFWLGYNFYKIIFDDINKELLLIEKGYL